MNYNYDTLKALAAKAGAKVPSLLALAPQNDPFYTGRPAELAAAEWFTKAWQQAGFTNGVHLRRVHYRLVSSETPVELPTVISWKDENGNKQETTTYQNNDACWKYLANAGKYARYLGYVDPDAFVDRRNPEAHIFAQDAEEPEPTVYTSDPEVYLSAPEVPRLDDLPELPDPPSLGVYGYDDIPQDYLVEVWAEKSTMNDVLEPLCRQYQVNLVTGLGELSITAVRQFLKRARAADKPTRILYVSDFDPAGFGMPVSIARKIEFYQRNDGFADLDIVLQPVVLTAEQITRYNLPRIPVKDSDQRKANFESAHGEGQVELDALEAIYPGELANILEAEILRYHDPELQRKAWRVEREVGQELSAVTDQVHRNHQAELENLQSEYSTLFTEYEALRQEFDELAKPFIAKLETIAAGLEALQDKAQETYTQIAEELEENAPGPDPLPDPDITGDPDSVLYASDRDYFDQLQAYQDRRNGA